MFDLSEKPCGHGIVATRRVHQNTNDIHFVFLDQGGNRPRRVHAAALRFAALCEDIAQELNAHYSLIIEVDEDTVSFDYAPLEQTPMRVVALAAWERMATNGLG